MTAFAWPYRYELLDGLRGVAALLVVMHHLGLVTVGHFAVMTFFVTSYSLYLIHQFNLTLVAGVAHRLLPAATPEAAAAL